MWTMTEVVVGVVLGVWAVAVLTVVTLIVRDDARRHRDHFRAAGSSLGGPRGVTGATLGRTDFGS